MKTEDFEEEFLDYYEDLKGIIIQLKGIHLICLFAAQFSKNKGCLLR